MNGRRRVAVVLLVITIAAAAAACGSGSDRSVANFCKTYFDQKRQFLSEYDNSNQQGLQAFATGMASVGEIPVVFDHLDKVAPDDIEPDVAAVRDSFKSQIDALGGAASNPLGALASGLVGGMTSAGPFQRVSDYITKNCPGAAGGSGP